MNNKNNHPDISVVMAVYNESKYIRQSINSILNQSLNNFEFIIIDDGSSDSTVEIINSYDDSRIKLLCIDHIGLPGALNYGIINSSSQLIARMDGDDIAFESRLKKQVNYLNINTNCVAVGGGVEVIDMHNNLLYEHIVPLSDSDIRKELPIVQMYHSNISFRKEIYIKCDCYNEKLLTAQDQLLFNKMSCFGELNNLEDITLKYRIHPEAISIRSKRNTMRLNKSIARILQNKNYIENDYSIINGIYKKNKTNKYHRNSLYYLTLGKIFIEKDFDRFKAFKYLIVSIIMMPFSITKWFNIALLLLPKTIVLYIKNLKK